MVRDVPEGAAQQQLELALIENIQRENLNPMDESLGYQRLTDEFGMTQEQIAAAVGKDRSTVANLLRLLRAAARRFAPSCRPARSPSVTRARCWRCRTPPTSARRPAR